MYIIAGLGNPGSKYEKTRHNMGFRVIDLLAEKYHIDMNMKNMTNIKIIYIIIQTMLDHLMSGKKKIISIFHLKIGKITM